MQRGGPACPCKTQIINICWLWYCMTLSKITHVILNKANVGIASLLRAKRRITITPCFCCLYLSEMKVICWNQMKLLSNPLHGITKMVQACSSTMKDCNRCCKHRQRYKKSMKLGKLTVQTENILDEPNVVGEAKAASFRRFCLGCHSPPEPLYL